MNRLVFSLVIASALLSGAGLAPAIADSETVHPAATVGKDGSKLALDVRMRVRVPLNIAWDVLTDFAHMPRYVPNLASSDVQAIEPGLLRVAQKGTAHWGPLSFDFESVRRIRLHPMSLIESTTLSGKISKMISVCELRQVDDVIEVHYHADAEIDFWLPPVVGTSAMRHELEEQFAAMAVEMERRKAAASK